MPLGMEQEGWGLGGQRGWNRGPQAIGAGAREAVATVRQRDYCGLAYRQVCRGEPSCCGLPPGLVELLNRVQSSGAHDQRGLLRKEDLVLPEFLQLPAQGSSSQETPPQTESAAQPIGGSLNSTTDSAL